MWYNYRLFSRIIEALTVYYYACLPLVTPTYTILVFCNFFQFRYEAKQSCFNLFFLFLIWELSLIWLFIICFILLKNKCLSISFEYLFLGNTVFLIYLYQFSIHLGCQKHSFTVKGLLCARHVLSAGDTKKRPKTAPALQEPTV